MRYFLKPQTLMAAIAREAHSCNFYKLVIAWQQHLLMQNFDWGKLSSLQLAFSPYDLISDWYVLVIMLQTQKHPNIRHVF